ncbi:MAG: hypothetical protein CL934_05425, partial [Deltaproteobacteria bacterium]|nr:hypothetical protein [Deltaproteobacteria bacterium]
EDEEDEEDEEGEEDEAIIGPLLIPESPPSTPESIALGRELTLKVECDKCHGKEGRADGPSALELKDDWNEMPIRPADWTVPWRFGGGNQPEDLFRTVRTGLNGTPMPSFAEDLSEEETWNVVHYIRSLAQGTEPEVKRTLVSTKTESPLTLEFDDSRWDSAREFYVPFSGQLVLQERLFQPAVHSMRFKSLYSETEIAFRIQWNDPSSSEHKEFGGKDEMTIQFPAQYRDGEREIPYFLMGRPGRSVNLWLWSDEQGKTIDAKASRLGEWTLQEEQSLQSSIRHINGQYTLIIKRERVNGHKGSIQFHPQRTIIPLAFSAVEGSSSEGGTRRGVTTWYKLLLEQPVGMQVYVVPVILFMIILGLEVLLMIHLRRKDK